MKYPLSFLLLVFCNAVSAQSDKDSVLYKKAEQYFSGRMSSDHIVGLSAAIIKNGKVAWKQGFGYADLEQKIPMTPGTVVNIGSITKTFTALALMQLYEKGKLDIYKPLNTYLPQFHPMARATFGPQQITVRSVMTHTSGIQSDIWKNSDLQSGKYTDVLELINHTYLLYPAGMVGLYSNAGYNILGHLVKTISGEDYPAYIHRHVFTPLGMSHSGFAMDKLKNRSKIYAYGRSIQEYELRDIASGGIYMDMNDFTRYAIALLNAYQGKKNPLIRENTLHQMFALQNADVPLESNKKGLGWFMFRNDSAFAMYHAGSAGFAQAKLLLFPKENAAVIVMTNTAEGGQAAEEFCFNMLPEFGLSIPDLFPKPITGIVHDTVASVSPTKQELENHTGSYAKAYSYATISVGEGYLKMQDGDNKLVLKPVNKNEYVPFISNKDGLKKKNNQFFFFKDIGGYHYLIQRVNNREYNWGYKLSSFDTTLWHKRTGLYDQFGYQMLIGDSKFKSVEIYISPENVLMCRLKTLGSTNEIPLDIIDDNHALSSGVNAGFGGFTVTFSENDSFQIVDFAGITYRKTK